MSGDRVAVIGAGMAGMSAAFRLKQAGIDTGRFNGAVVSGLDAAARVLSGRAAWRTTPSAPVSVGR
jgi:cation diffusion facilitator CzcD-associated flavoprotein CzcO